MRVVLLSVTSALLFSASANASCTRIGNHVYCERSSDMGSTWSQQQVGNSMSVTVTDSGGNTWTAHRSVKIKIQNEGIGDVKNCFQSAFQTNCY
jgi:hypothetical protein